MVSRRLVFLSSILATAVSFFTLGLIFARGSDASVRAVYDALYQDDPDFTSDDVRALVRARPDLVMFGGDRRV